MKRIIPLGMAALLIVVLVLTGCQLDTQAGIAEDTLVGSESERGITTRGQFDSVITCYWLFDEHSEPWSKCRCTKPIYTGTINWSANPPTVSNVTPIKDGNTDVWVNGGIYARYSMEGSGIYYAQNEIDFVIQLQDFFLTADPETGDITNLPIFAKLSRADWKWGQGYLTDEVALRPWKTAAVTKNIVPGSTIEVPVLAGKQFVNPDTGNTFPHSGEFIAEDTSWSFDYDDLMLSQNAGANVKAWIDLFTATYDGYQATDLIFKPIANDSSDSRVRWVNLYEKNESGAIILSPDNPQYAVTIKAQLQSASTRQENSMVFSVGHRYTKNALVVYNGKVYKCKRTHTASNRKKPTSRKGRRWYWRLQGDFVQGGHTTL